LYVHKRVGACLICISGHLKFLTWPTCPCDIFSYAVSGTSFLLSTNVPLLPPWHRRQSPSVSSPQGNSFLFPSPPLVVPNSPPFLFPFPHYGNFLLVGRRRGLVLWPVHFLSFTPPPPGVEIHPNVLILACFSAQTPIKNPIPNLVRFTCCSRNRSLDSLLPPHILTGVPPIVPLEGLPHGHETSVNPPGWALSIPPPLLCIVPFPRSTTVTNRLNPCLEHGFLIPKFTSCPVLFFLLLVLDVPVLTATSSSVPGPSNDLPYCFSPLRTSRSFFIYHGLHNQGVIGNYLGFF